MQKLHNHHLKLHHESYTKLERKFVLLYSLKQQILTNTLSSGEDINHYTYF